MRMDRSHSFKWAFTSINLFISFLLLSPISLHEKKKKGIFNSIELKQERMREREKR